MIDRFRSLTRHGSLVVDSQRDLVEWTGSTHPFPRDRDGDRCLPAGMESLLSRQAQVGQTKRRVFTSQRAGTLSSTVQSPVLSEGCAECECPPQERQHHHCVLYQSSEWNEVALVGQHGEGAMVVGLREGYCSGEMNLSADFMSCHRQIGF